MAGRAHAGAVTVAVALAFWAAFVGVFAATIGEWGGVTAQGHAFRFIVGPTDDVVAQFRFGINTPCQSRQENVSASVPVGGDRFGADAETAGGCRARIDGTFTSPLTASGTVTVSTNDPTRCGCPGVEGAPMPFPPVTTTWSAHQGCPYSVSPNSFEAGIATTPGVTSVVTGPACQWTALSEANFIKVTSGSSGTGNASVAFTVAANVDPRPGFLTPTRSGVIRIGGEPFLVTQPGCTFTIAPRAASYGSTGGTGEVEVTAPLECPWDVAALPPWAATISGGVGQGNGTWRYTVFSNQGARRSHFMLVAGNVFKLTEFVVPMLPLVVGGRRAFALADSSAEAWSSFEAMAGRSYCAELAAARDAVDKAAPILFAYRADATTLLGNDARATPRVCFIAPATETVLLNAVQADTGARSYRLAIAETTLWANWFFTGGEYSSFTTLRNTSDLPVGVLITWRTTSGVMAGSTSVIIPSKGAASYDARTMAPAAVTGSVEIAHDGPPQGLVGSQSTLSPTAGIAFDSVLMERRTW